MGAMTATGRLPYFVDSSTAHFTLEYSFCGCWIELKEINVHHFVRWGWDNEVIGENLFLLIVTARCYHISMLYSLTPILYVVRTSLHVGDPAELRDAGHVSSLWRHQLWVREVWDSGGKSHFAFFKMNSITFHMWHCKCLREEPVGK